MAGSPAATQTAPDVKQFVSGQSVAEMPRRAHVEREGMNLGQAIAGSSHHLAIRQVGDRRVIVDRGQEFLTVLIQRRSKSRWIADDNRAYTHQINTYRVSIERNDGAVKRVGDVRSETGLSRLSMWDASSCSFVRTPQCRGGA